MKTKEKIAKVIANVAMKMAKKACGAASAYGVYQPKEPSCIDKFKK